MRWKLPKGTVEISSTSDSASFDVEKTDINRWSDIDSFEKSWEIRAKFASNYIPSGSNVLDLGCGLMTLEKHLPEGCTYIPCDIVKRDERTVVCDFNKFELPEETIKAVDIIVLLGVCEYIFELDKFITILQSLGKTCLISYNPTDLSKNVDRKKLGWVNNYSLQQLENIISKTGFHINRLDRIDSSQVILCLNQEQKHLAREKNIAVLSFNNVGNFGDRLGYHLINNILPSNAYVEFLNFSPFSFDNKHLDLLIIGIGNSMFQPVINDRLFDLMSHADNCIGIFGTQYREDIPKDKINSLLDRLTFWYSRYQDDLYLYGRGRNNVMHLGDWLITAFPNVKSKSDKTLKIGDEVWKDLPLDRIIQNIQNHKKVLSTRLHPLLCALTSAEQVAYIEQRETKSDIASGKFRSMLVDIFHRTYPENTFWEVDHDMVTNYKNIVTKNISHISKTINNLI